LSIGKRIKYQSSSEERSSTKRKLTSGEVSFIFSVDLYNEGIESNCELGVALLHPVHEKPLEIMIMNVTMTIIMMMKKHTIIVKANGQKSFQRS
jgi:hypothetical protein